MGTYIRIYFLSLAMWVAPEKSFEKFYKEIFYLWRMILYTYDSRKNLKANKKIWIGDFNMDKDLIEFLGFDEKEVITKHEDIDSYKNFNNVNKTLKVKVFSVGLLTNETINKFHTQSTEYNEFINLKEVEVEALKDNDELLCETDLVLLIGEIGRAHV